MLELFSGDGDLPSDQVEEDCLKGDPRSLLGQLPHLREQVLRMLDGMGWEAPMSLTCIGRILGMSRDLVEASSEMSWLVCAGSVLWSRFTSLAEQAT